MKTNILEEFGKTIRHFRVKMGLTQEEFAELTGFHRTYIGQIERGERNPSLKNIEILANSIGISMDDLFVQLRKIRNK